LRTALCPSYEIDVGHFGHPEADEVNRMTSDDKPWDERDAILRKLFEQKTN
jgi:hypothetical protein